MIIYFADREMRVLGHATTNLPKGYVITEDQKTEEIETGVATFSCRVGFKKENRAALEEMTNAGNFLLRSHDGENEFYTIIDTEIDTKNQDIYIYAEDAGLDLINEIAGDFEATESYNAEWYINKYIKDSGFKIGTNEIPKDTTRKLAWEGEETVTARLASIATQFGGYEISYSYDIEGLEITNKYVNIHKERGKDKGIQLRLNRDIDRIVTTKSVANLATAFVCEGGVPDNEEEPITLKGYAFDDGDFYVDANGILKSRKAAEKWRRHFSTNGYISKQYSYDTTDQKTLCSHAVTELKKVCDMEVNYEIDIKRLPEGVKIGDRINIVDDAGEMYVSTRILLLETSVVDQKYTATLGEHLIKTSGISQTVTEQAAKFAENAAATARALSLAAAARTTATEAKEQAQNVEEATTANETNITKAESLIQELAESTSTLITDGNGASLMVPTENGWTFSTGAIQEAVDNATKNLGELQAEMGDVNSTVEVLDAAVKDLGVLAEYIKIGTYTYTDEDGNQQTEPSIDLGENDTGFRLKITNTRIWFTDGATDLVSIDSKNKSLEIEKATIKGELQIGDDENKQVEGVWIWKQRSNGNLGLMWKGVNN